jgi:outer membrane receptor protein involved in Fe transport
MMMLKKKWAVEAVALSLLWPLGAAAQSTPGGAAAEAQPGEQSAQSVVVTGSRIQRRDADGVGPMLTLSKDDMKFTSPTSVGDLLQAMPSTGVSLNSNGTQGTSYGVSSVNLRYLGSAEGSGNRTLVLVDGHRWGNAAGGRGFRDFVDLNTIPLGIIDHIEVLKDGASAIYGADAIAGVVNIYTKKRLDGFESDLRLGQSSRNDGDNVSGYLNWGKRFDKGSLFLSASFNDTKPIATADRDITRAAYAALTAAPTSPQGLYVLPGLSNNAYFGTAAGYAQNAANAVTRNLGVSNIGGGASADNSFHTATLPGDYYNTMTQGMQASGPSKRGGFFGRATYQIGEDTTARVEALYSERKSSQLYAPFSMDIRGSNGFRISNDQAYNPFGTANGVPAANALAFSGSVFRIQRVASEVGNRLIEQDVKLGRVLLGLDGQVDWYGDWRWDATATYTKSRANFDSYNQINLDNVYNALASPAVCAAAPGCTPLNIFGAITPQMADYIRYNAHDKNGTSQTDVAFNATRTLMELPAGDLGLATGYEYRRETGYDAPDLFSGSISSVLPAVSGVGQSPTTNAGRSPTDGSYSLQEAYAEVSVPLLKDKPGVQYLELDAAVRYSHYSTVGGKATTKLGLLYRPVKSTMLRGTYSQGFRAPSISELYQGQRQTNFQAVDPCNGGGAGLPGCAGIPASYNQSLYNSGLMSGITAGNAQLKAETADTYSVGLAWTPASIEGLTFTADKFLIKIKDAIASQTATQILQACATTGAFCDLVRRGASGEVSQLTQAVVNLSRLEVAGVDATLRYVFPAGKAKIDSALDVSYLERYRSFVPQADGSVVIDDRAGKSDQPRSTFPRVKAQASLRYLAAAYTAGWKARYIGGSDDIAGNAVNGGKTASVVYHDLQVGHTLPGGNVTLAIGIDNVFDKMPPASAANNPINFDMYTYDPRGRYFYAKVSTKF